MGSGTLYLNLTGLKDTIRGIYLFYLSFKLFYLFKTILKR